MAELLLNVGELPSYWRPLTDSETDVAVTLLIVASALIRGRFTDIDARIQAGTLDAAIVKYVVAEMVKSAVESGNRPVDAKSVSETVGPFTQAVTYGAASRLVLTDDLADLLGVSSAAEVGSARLGMPVYATPLVCNPDYTGYGSVGVPYDPDSPTWLP